jgi:Icc-related predicted phosphoesterase
MNLLLFSDLHCDHGAARRLVEQAAAVDVVVGAGDFANVRRGLRDVVAILRAIERPVVLVPGNSETTDELRTACRDWPNAHVLHGSSVTLDGVEFYGLGAAVPVTPFGAWSFDLTEDEAADLLADAPSGGILVSHSPPKGAVDRDSSGRSLGSTAVRSAIEAKQPALVVCGHIHGSAGQSARIGETVVINAGPDGQVYTLGE